LGENRESEYTAGRQENQPSRRKAVGRIGRREVEEVGGIEVSRRSVGGRGTDRGRSGSVDGPDYVSDWYFCVLYGM
jgi:hypothetical protein